MQHSCRWCIGWKHLHSTLIIRMGSGQRSTSRRLRVHRCGGWRWEGGGHWWGRRMQIVRHTCCCKVCVWGICRVLLDPPIAPPKFTPLPPHTPLYTNTPLPTNAPHKQVGGATSSPMTTCVAPLYQSSTHSTGQPPCGSTTVIVGLDMSVPTTASHLPTCFGRISCFHHCDAAMEHVMCRIMHVHTIEARVVVVF